MSVNIRATSFTKKKNSTKRPSSYSKSYDVLIKDNCDWNNPTFILNASDFPYNYIRWGDQYYFVSGVSYVRNNLLEVSCETDVLATFKESILNTSAFVVYDTTANSEISDKRLSIKTTTNKAENAGNAFEFLGKGFSVAINVVGQDSCCCYITTAERALTLLNHASVWNADYFPEVEDPSGGSIFGDVAEAVQKLDRIITYACRQFITSNSAAGCITSACIIPLPYSAFATAESDIYLGQFNTTVKGKRQVSRGFQDASFVTIPWQASDWRRNSPYHEIYLYIPFIGNISIPATSVIGASGLYIDVSIDETSGDSIFTVTTSPISAGSATNVIGQYTTNLSANFPIGSANVTAKQLATTIASAGVAVVSSAVAPSVSAAAAGAMGIVGEMNGISALPSSIGGAGGGAVLALFGYAPRCMTIFHDTVVDPNSVSGVIGTPTMSVKQLSTLTGFVQCSNAHVECSGHSDEINQIDTFLNTGFYIE